MSLVVHPYADAFPLLPADALAALADDIKANGLRHPIVTWTDSNGQTWLIDGRNRLAACELAGIEPAFKAFDGDPIAYITSEGFRRRDLTAGKRAIVAVRSPLYSVYSQTELAAVAGVPQPRIGEAVIIVEYGGELADEVMADRVPFQTALQDARKRRGDKLERERRDGELRAEAPDLITLIADEVLTFDEAWAAYQKRTEAERVRVAELEDGRRRRNLGAAEAVYQLAWGAHETESFLTDVYPKHTDHVANGMQLTAARLDSAIATLTTLRRGITR